MPTSSHALPRPLKRVRFDNVVSVLCRVPTVEDKHHVWYSKAEFAAFTKELRSTIRKLRKQATLLARLEEAFQFSLSLAGNLVDEYDEETALLRIRSHESMTSWMGKDLKSFRGLECLSSPLIKCHSSLCKDVNARLGDFIKTGHSDDEDVQRLCSKNSRCSRIFARLMAECDAKAATAFMAEESTTTTTRSVTPTLDSEEEEEDEESCVDPPVKKLKTMSGGRRVLVPATYGSEEVRQRRPPTVRMWINPNSRKHGATWKLSTSQDTR